MPQAMNDQFRAIEFNATHIAYYVMLLHDFHYFRERLHIYSFVSFSTLHIREYTGSLSRAAN